MAKKEKSLKKQGFKKAKKFKQRLWFGSHPIESDKMVLIRAGGRQKAVELAKKQFTNDRFPEPHVNVIKARLPKDTIIYWQNFNEKDFDNLKYSQ